MYLLFSFKGIKKVRFKSLNIVSIWWLEAIISILIYLLPSIRDLKMFRYTGFLPTFPLCIYVSYILISNMKFYNRKKYN